MRLSAVALLLVVPLWAAAQEKKEPPKIVPIAEVKLDRKDLVVYEKEIEPIFANKCMFCHSGNVVESKFEMSSYDKLMKGGKRGTPSRRATPPTACSTRCRAAKTRR